MLDTETNDGDPRHAHLVQVAVVACTGDGRVVERFSSHVRPPDGDVGPTHVHRITVDDVLRAPTAEEVLPDLARVLRGRVRVAHNLPFDAAVLDRVFARAGYQPGPVADLDTLTLSAGTDGPRGHGLGALCQARGIPLTGWHDARADAAATASLLTCLLAEQRIRRVRDLVRVAPSVARRADWPDPVLDPGVVARVVAEKAVPPDLFRQRGASAAEERARRRAEAARARAERVRFRRVGDDDWRVVGPPGTIAPGPIEVTTRRGVRQVDVLDVEPAPDDAGVPQVWARFRWPEDEVSRPDG